MGDRIEFWIGKSILLAIDSSFAPVDGDLINIQKITYRVIGRSFTVDYANTPQRQMRCKVILEQQP